MNLTYAERYGDFERWHWWFRGRQRIIEAVLGRLLHADQSRIIVSVGCGPVAGLEWLVPLAGPTGRVIGVDTERGHGSSGHPGVAFVVSRAQEAGVRTKSADLLLALDVLEHLDDDADALREAARLVKPGGLIVVTVPAMPSLWGRQDEISHHRRRYRRTTLHAAFVRAGLPGPHIAHFNSLLFVPIAAVRWLRQALGMAGREGTDFDCNRPGWPNRLLGALFGLERHLIYRVPLPAGVSLLATVRVP